jgi:hypothetical protein
MFQHRQLYSQYPELDRNPELDSDNGREEDLLWSLIRIFRLNGYYPSLNYVSAQLYTG